QYAKEISASLFREKGSENQDHDHQEHQSKQKSGDAQEPRGGGVVVGPHLAQFAGQFDLDFLPHLGRDGTPVQRDVVQHPGQFHVGLGCFRLRQSSQRGRGQAQFGGGGDGVGRGVQHLLERRSGGDQQADALARSSQSQPRQHLLESVLEVGGGNVIHDRLAA